MQVTERLSCRKLTKAPDKFPRFSQMLPKCWFYLFFSGTKIFHHEWRFCRLALMSNLSGKFSIKSLLPTVSGSMVPFLRLLSSFACQEDLRRLLSLSGSSEMVIVTGGRFSVSDCTTWRLWLFLSSDCSFIWRRVIVWG